MTLRKIIAALLLVCSVSAAALERQSNDDYRARRQKLGALAKGGAVLLFASTEASAGDAISGFRQNNNFYYLTGNPEPGGAVLVVGAREAADDKPAREYSEVLFLPARNMVQEKWTGPKLGPDSPEARQVTGFDRVASLETLPRVLAELGPTRIYADVPRWNGTSPDAQGIEGLARLNAISGQVADAKPLLAQLRMVKDAGELALIRKATDASVAAHLAAMHAMKPGINEREISALMQYEFLRRGCERSAYAPIVGSGFYSTVLHYSADDKTVADGDVAVLDVGGEYGMYATDITRTLPANGRFTDRQREIYNIVLGAQQAAIHAFVAGKSMLRGDGPDSLNKVARDYINTHGKDLHGEPLGKYFIHGLGHFVGLEVHDPGENVPLTAGMVFTLEPGIYIPEEKLGVRIEDTFMVAADGSLVSLSAKLPRTAEDVEREMKKR
ncbi:MAG TPA: Xaa-Pro peptidase family protein [Terriglobales bacterium]|nr:Xaa-Pro peptidase family protein [Terriglobales bacterium]